jgi:hypothetical protein
MDKCETVTPSLINQNSDVPGGQAGLANINVNGRVMILPAIWDPIVSFENHLAVNLLSPVFTHTVFLLF